MDYAERLLAWFDINKREMPWRNTSDPYAIWVSEIMLQQTQVDTVIPYYYEFMERFPTIHSLASVPLEEVLTYWQGLGYYRRAENLHKGAQLIDREYNAIFPTDSEIIKKIPGIGPYTLGAILSIAFHVPIAAVDGNVMRILSRQFLIEEDISVAKNRKAFEEKVMVLMPSDPNRFNQALMELGALICTPKAPKCIECPMNSLCEGQRTGTAMQYPVKSQKVKNKCMSYFVITLIKEDALWMEKRPEEGLLANLWGLPMLDAAQWEELKKTEISFKLGNEVTHVFTHRKWHMTPVFIKWTEQTNDLLGKYIREDIETKLIKMNQIKEFPIGTAFKKIIRDVKI